MEQYRISFVGAGKVSRALAQKLYNTGFRLQEIMSKTEASRQTLADLCNASPKSDLEFKTGTDIIIVAVPDDALEPVLKSISCGEDVIVAHTAGSAGLEVFPEHIKHKGVLYPLQTFSDNRIIEFRDVPFFIEASDTFTAETLQDLAESTGGKVNFAGTERRRLLHAAAVFVCNFTNHMLAAGKEITTEAGFSFEVLEPLINETITKALQNGPEVSQTGPAVRGDKGTIANHIGLLSFSPDLQELYREVTESIMNTHKKKSDEQF